MTETKINRDKYVFDDAEEASNFCYGITDGQVNIGKYKELRITVDIVR